MKLGTSSFVLIGLLFAGTFVFGQNVGIGTAAPKVKLHILSNSNADGLMIDNSAGNGDPILQFGLDGNPAITMGLDDSDGDKFKIGTTSITTNTRLTIQSNGNVGIGTTAPAHFFHILANRAADYGAVFENTEPSGAAVAGFSSSTSNAVGAVTNNPEGLGLYAVHLPNTGSGWAISAYSYSSDAIAVHGRVETGGSHLGYAGFFAGGLGYMNGLYNLSDARVKKNVVGLHDALAKVKGLRGVTFQYDTEAYGQYAGNDQHTYLGFVAQEVEQIVPEAVAEKYLVSGSESNGKPIADMTSVERTKVKVVDYVSLVPLLVEAIKEQQTTIENLEKRIKELEEQH
jgi:hypothetical protein